jgi:hypothetical protein
MNRTHSLSLRGCIYHNLTHAPSSTRPITQHFGGPAESPSFLKGDSLALQEENSTTVIPLSFRVDLLINVRGARIGTFQSSQLLLVIEEER